MMSQVPPDSRLQRIAGQPVRQQSAIGIPMIRGRCLCGTVRYEIRGSWAERAIGIVPFITDASGLRRLAVSWSLRSSAAAQRER